MIRCDLHRRYQQGSAAIFALLWQRIRTRLGAERDLVVFFMLWRLGRSHYISIPCLHMAAATAGQEVSPDWEGVGFISPPRPHNQSLSPSVHFSKDTPETYMCQTSETHATSAIHFAYDSVSSYTAVSQATLP